MLLSATSTTRRTCMPSLAHGVPLLRRVEPNLRLQSGSWTARRGSELHQLLRASGCGRARVRRPASRARTPAPPSTLSLHPPPQLARPPRRYVADLRDVLQRARVFVVPVLWANGVITNRLAHVHGLPTATVAAAQPPRPCRWCRRRRERGATARQFEKIRVASVAASAELAAATLHLYHNQSRK